MRDPNDTRDIGPRVGSPLWIHMTSVTVAGFGVFVWAMMHLSGLPQLVRHPLFWVIAALIVVGELRPIVAAGGERAVMPGAARTLIIASRLFRGLPSAARG